MARALLTLLAGILLAVLLAALIAGDRDLLAVLGPVLVTVGVGTAVMAVVAWRARIRERAQQLEDDDLPTETHTDPLRVTDEDTHRG